MSFSQKKFRSFSTEKQKKKLFDLLQQIENCWDDISTRQEKIAEYNRLNFIADSDFSKVDFCNKRTFFYSLAELENSHQIYKRDYQILNKDGEKSSRKSEKLPLVLILDNLRSAFNVGAILRTAECFNIQKVCFCGVTPDLQNPKVQKTSMGCWQRLDTANFSSTSEAILACRKVGYAIYALETTTGSLPLSCAKFDRPTALVLGNEALGIDEQTLRLCDAVYQIELQGWKNSLNVGICCGIALYELSQKKKNG